MDNKVNMNNNSASNGIGFSGLLTIVFIVLKLIGVINWSWLWVLSPLWIGAALGIIVILIVFIIAARTGGTVTIRRKNR